MSTRCLFVLLTLSALRAHSLYILPQRFNPAQGEAILISIHSGDAFPNSEDIADPSRFIGPRLIGPAGEQALTGFQILGRATHATATIYQSNPVWLTLSTQPRSFELDAFRFEPYLLAEGLDWVVAERARSGTSDKPGRERYAKFAKTLLNTGPAGAALISKPLGLTIEIVPLANPATLKPGALLPVQVLLRGKPAAGLQIEAAWAPKQGYGERYAAGRTGPDGILKIPLKQSGRWRLNTVSMERSGNLGVADWDSYWASLTFEVP